MDGLLEAIDESLSYNPPIKALPDDLAGEGTVDAARRAAVAQAEGRRISTVVYPDSEEGAETAGADWQHTDGDLPAHGTHGVAEWQAAPQLVTPPQHTRQQQQGQRPQQHSEPQQPLAAAKHAEPRSQAPRVQAPRCARTTLLMLSWHSAACMQLHVCAPSLLIAWSRCGEESTTHHANGMIASRTPRSCAAAHKRAVGGGCARVDAWRAFASHQARRYAPALPSAARRVLPETRTYRLRVERAVGLPDIGAPAAGGAASAGGAVPPGLGGYELEVVGGWGVLSLALRCSTLMGARQCLLGCGHAQECTGNMLLTSSGICHVPPQGVSFYDETLGAFYGATCRSAPEAVAPAGAGAVALAPTAASGGTALAAAFGFDLFYHSRISDPRCIAVVGGQECCMTPAGRTTSATHCSRRFCCQRSRTPSLLPHTHTQAELVIVERSEDGVVSDHYSLGWAALPLLDPTLAGSDAAGAGAGDGGVEDGVVGQVVSSPVMAGSPRYLMLR